MQFKKYSFCISLIIGLISIFPFESKIKSQELFVSESEINTENLDHFDQNFSFDNSINLNDLEITNQEAWQVSQKEHQHHNSETNHQQETEEEWEHSLHGEKIFWSLLVDKLEYRVNDSSNTFNWDAKGWVGGDYQRLGLKTEGDVDLESGNGAGEIQLLYSKLVHPFWDLQLGVRYDQLYGDDSKGRGFAVIGIEGVAPYFFDIDTALFVSHQGDISFRFKTEYELLLAQRLVLQPSLETNIAIQQVEDFGIGSGFNDIELGLRLRYEITRNFAPYIGVNWTRLLGDTADFAKEEGESIDEVSGVLGLRLLF